MAYRRIGLAGGQLVQKGLGSIRQGYGGPQDWGQEAAAKQQGAANVPTSNPYSQAAQQQNRDLNERVSREGRSNIAKQNFQQGLKDYYNKHQGFDGGIRTIGGGIRNFFGGLGDKFGAWAGKMRGGINPATNTWYTQDEYEQNVQNRRDRATIDRIRNTRDTKYAYANDPTGKLWDQSPLKTRLGGLEKQFGIDQPVDASGLFEQEQIDATPINNRRNVYDFDDVTFNEGIAPAITAGSLEEDQE